MNPNQSQTQTGSIPGTTATIAEMPKFDAGEFIGLAIPLASFIVGIIAILGWVIVSTNRTREREKTKRELAAYVAEGSMTPEQAERMIAADIPIWQKDRGWDASRHAAETAAATAAQAQAAAAAAKQGGCRNGRITGINFDIANGKVGVTRA